MIINARSMNFRISRVPPSYFLMLILSITAFALPGNIYISDLYSAAKTVIPDKRISLFYNRVSFVPPAGLKQLASKQVTAKFSNDEGIRYVFANGSGKGKVLIYVADIDMKPEQLSEVKGFVERMHRDYSGWVASEMVTINGRQWFHFEWKKPVLDDLALLAPPANHGEPAEVRDNRPLYYNEFTTSFNGKPLRFVFESLVNEYPQVKEAFMKSAQTIHIKG